MSYFSKIQESAGPLVCISSVHLYKVYFVSLGQAFNE
uniref:Uncharacterized protein n=1 Tax=Arundo donax TaxID=35708 RepID=A0A0A9CCW1_ARUDO